MRSSKLWYFLALCMLSVLPLVGCSGSSGGGSTANPSKLSVKAVGKVDDGVVVATKAAAVDGADVYAIDAQTGSELGTTKTDANGDFELEFTLPDAKSVVVFKAVKGATVLRSIVAFDLTDPGKVVGKTAPTININQGTTDAAAQISTALGLSGILGDEGQTLSSEYDAVEPVIAENGGTVLGYAGNGNLYIVGSVDDGTGANEGAAKTAAESCGTCHANGKANGVDAVHGLIKYGELTPTFTGATVSGDDLVLNFNVKINGANKNNYYNGLAAGVRLGSDNNRTTNLQNTAVLAGGSNGNYTVTITNGAVNAGDNSRYIFELFNTADKALGTANAPLGARVMVLADYPASPIVDVIGNSISCEDCHGFTSEIRVRNGSRYQHYDYPSHGGKTCRTCHGAANYTNRTELAPLIHGIHNSAKMPTGGFIPQSLAGDPKNYNYSIGFPSYMQNCSTCHQDATARANANAAAVSYKLCMSCHQSWDSFKGDAISFHTTMTDATNCATCHDGAMAKATMGEMHDGANKGAGLTSGRGGLIVKGVDLAVQEGAKINQKITGVTRTGNNLSITWEATYNGAAVDPCNATPTTSAPSFAHTGHNFSFLKGFLQGEDVVNANNGNAAPGQPNSTNVVFGDGGNTTCSDKVATTVIALTDAEAKLEGNARVGLQGRPNMKTDNGKTYLVRAKSPVYDFKLADGSAVKAGSAVARRPIADIDSCLKCHVGSLYQHGGNRIDSVDLCIICHNEASSDQNTRADWGINKDNAYDGKVGHTYGFKSLLHKIHASGTKDKNGAYMLNPFAIYRPAQGVYGYSPEEDLLRNWPGTGQNVVFASNPEQTKKHAYVVAHYPRPLQDCSACHVKGFSVIPDPTKAVATTIDAGKAPWSNQLDDTLIGPATAACISCHTGSAATAHAYQNSWAPAKLEKGRQTVIDSAK